MGVGKYSPTVSRAYMKDQQWWEKNGGYVESADKLPWYDNDGYDSYGYNADGVDRAGNTELDYINQYEIYDDQITYHLAEDVQSNWGIDEKGLPKDLSTLSSQNKPRI
jgi:hypothetical protein